ncbi:hypothetical protein OH705_07355 [Pseudomonas sp. BJa3]|nr:hypothetical protein [Pseudomonas sp. BJa3]
MGQKLNAAIGGDLQERIEGVRKSLAAGSQRLQAPKTWLVSEEVNVLQVLCGVLDLVQKINTELAGHVHGPTPPPSNAAAFTRCAGSALMLATRLKPITS